MILENCNDVTFLTKQSRVSGKTGKEYFLYTFLCDGNIYQNIYSTVNIDIVCNTNVNVKLKLKSYNNEFNIEVIEVTEYGN